MSKAELKAQLITWIASLWDDDPLLGRVDAIRHGGEPTGQAEPWRSLKEISQMVRRNPVWLTRLNVQRVGNRLGGRLSYRLNDVLQFLQSPECANRIRELHAERVCREQAKKKGTTV